MNPKEFISAYNRKLRSYFFRNIDSAFAKSDNENQRIPLYDSTVSAGFPSPAADHIESRLTTDEYLIKNATATFFVRVKGDSMIDAGINHGDILVVDRSLDPRIGNIVLAEIDGEFTVKYLGRQQLIPANPKYPTISFIEGQTVVVIGVATGLMRKLL